MRSLKKLAVVALTVVWPALAFAGGGSAIKPISENKFVSASSPSGEYEITVEFVKGKQLQFALLRDGEESPLVPSRNSGVSGWRLVPLAVNDSGQVIAIRSTFSRAVYVFELYDADGNASIIGEHRFQDLWTTQGVKVAFDNDGRAAVTVIESIDKGPTTETEYFFDGESLQPSDNTEMLAATGSSSLAKAKRTRASARKSRKGRKSAKRPRPTMNISVMRNR